ncbi:GNAT family N-acetyltransferase [Candidatus Woesearchaeota archaeon]|nr:GNAT family N-acetyltransferase [Candidatus Woesearchaeota archaeon]
MEIRKAEEKDLEEIFKLKLKLKKEEKKADRYLRPITRTRDIYKKYLARDLRRQGMDRIILVAVRDRKIIGYVRGTLTRTLHILNVRLRGTIDNLYIEKKYRKNGAAKDLIKELIIWFREKKVDVMTLHVYPSNHKAVSLYKKLGFREYTINMNKKLD